MSNKTRLTIWSIFAVIAVILGVANRGFHQTWPMLLAFLVIGVGYEVINYFVIRKRLRK
jgi:hypothetical protein